MNHPLLPVPLFQHRASLLPRHCIPAPSTPRPPMWTEIAQKFTFPLHVSIEHYEHSYAVLITPFVYYLDDPWGDYILVPREFRTDFYSFPRFYRAFAHPLDRGCKAAVIHDYLYVGGYIIRSDTGKSYRPTRKEADLIFYDAMLVSGVKRSVAKRYYRAVRMFGKSKGYWDNPNRDMFR